MSALLASTTALWAQSDVTQPGDPIFASSGNSPGSEGVANAIDNKTTKYLNFDSGRDGNQIGTFSPSGFAVTPSVGLTRVTGMTIQSANDQDPRDPDVVLLEGSNDEITGYNSGTWEPITTISNIAAGFTSRFQSQTFTFENLKPYRSYRWTVNSVRTTPNGCCMQVAEVELLGAVVPQDVTQPGDPLIASSGNSPGSEGVANAIDNKTTKYLNFDSGRDGNQIGTFSPSGFVVTPAIGRTLVTGITMQSANDQDPRDPDVITLEGSNDENITSFSGGNWEPITTISNIAAGFTARFQEQTFLFDNVKPYRSYRWTVNSVRTTPNGCCMQVAEVQLLGTTAPQDITQPGDLIFASSANSPGSEGVANAIDNKTTKYLNFDSGRDGNQIGTFSPSGFAVQPAVGPTTVIGMTIQSANDQDPRDPDVVLLEGSNDDVLTGYNSGTWEPIATISNIAAGFTSRFQVQEFYFPNSKSYKNYRWTVQSVRTTPNGCCMQVAEVELLAPVTTAPEGARFLAQPVNTPVLLGQPATFRVTLNGPWPVQWYRNGVAIPGANKATYTTEPVTADSATNVYTVEILGRETSVPVSANIFTPSATKSIAVSFEGSSANGAPTRVNTNDIIGLWPQAYWNNANGGSGNLPTELTVSVTDPDTGEVTDTIIPYPVYDSDGNDSPITVEYTTGGTWGSGTGVDTPVDRMLNGVVGEDDAGGTPSTITFSGVPDGQHAVIVYAVSPPLQFQTVRYSVNSTPEQTYFMRVLNSDEYNAAPGWYRAISTTQAGATAGNLIRFDGVRPVGGVVTLTFETMTTAPEITGVNGIQLILNATAPPPPPTITASPVPSIVAAGGTARLTVTATGEGLTYQWRKNGRNLPNGANVSGATTSTLNISDFSEDDEAIYSVAVFNAGGSALSQNAAVRISEFDVNEALAAYLTFNETSGTTVANAVSGGASGSVVGTATWGAGKVANALTLDGASYVIVTNYTKARGEIGGSMWVNLDPSNASSVSLMRNAQGGLAVGGANSGQFDLSVVFDDVAGTLHLRVQIAAGPNIVTVTDPQPFTTGSLQHVAFSADGAQLRLFKNGQEVGSVDYRDTLITPNVTHLSIGGQLVRDPDTGEISLDPSTPETFVGTVDDLALWNRGLTASEVSKIYAAGNAGQALSTIVIDRPQEPVDGPELDVAVAGGNITISWTGSGFKLQSTDNVGDPASWTDVTGVTGTSYTAAASGNRRFYRLVSQ